MADGYEYNASAGGTFYPLPPTFPYYIHPALLPLILSIMLYWFSYGARITLKLWKSTSRSAINLKGGIPLKGSFRSTTSATWGNAKVRRRTKTGKGIVYPVGKDTSFRGIAALRNVRVLRDSRALLVSLGVAASEEIDLNFINEHYATNRLIGWLSLYWEIPTMLLMPFFVLNAWPESLRVPFLTPSSFLYVGAMSSKLLMNFILWLSVFSVTAMEIIRHMDSKRRSKTVKRLRYICSRLLYDMFYIIIIYRAAAVFRVYSCEPGLGSWSSDACRVVYTLNVSGSTNASTTDGQSAKMQVTLISWKYVQMAFCLYVLVFIFRGALDYVIYEKNATDPAFMWIPVYNAASFAVKAGLSATVSVLNYHPVSAMATLIASNSLLGYMTYRFQPCLGKGRTPNNMRFASFMGGTYVATLGMLSSVLDLDEKVRSRNHVLSFYGAIILGATITVWMAWLANDKRAREYCLPNVPLKDMLGPMAHPYVRKVASQATLMRSLKRRGLAFERDFIRALRDAVQDQAESVYVRWRSAAALLYFSVSLRDDDSPSSPNRVASRNGAFQASPKSPPRRMSVADALDSPLRAFRNIVSSMKSTGSSRTRSSISSSSRSERTLERSQRRWNSASITKRYKASCIDVFLRCIEGKGHHSLRSRFSCKVTVSGRLVAPHDLKNLLTAEDIAEARNLLKGVVMNEMGTYTSSELTQAAVVLAAADSAADKASIYSVFERNNDPDELYLLTRAHCLSMSSPLSYGVRASIKWLRVFAQKLYRGRKLMIEELLGERTEFTKEEMDLQTHSMGMFVYIRELCPHMLNAVTDAANTVDESNCGMQEHEARAAFILRNAILIVHNLWNACILGAPDALAFVEWGPALRVIRDASSSTILDVQIGARVLCFKLVESANNLEGGDDIIAASTLSSSGIDEDHRKWLELSGHLTKVLAEKLRTYEEYCKEAFDDDEGADCLLVEKKARLMETAKHFFDIGTKTAATSFKMPDSSEMHRKFMSTLLRIVTLDSKNYDYTDEMGKLHRSMTKTETDGGMRTIKVLLTCARNMMSDIDLQTMISMWGSESPATDVIKRRMSSLQSLISNKGSGKKTKDDCGRVMIKSPYRPWTLKGILNSIPAVDARNDPTIVYDDEYESMTNCSSTLASMFNVELG